MDKGSWLCAVWHKSYCVFRHMFYARNSLRKEDFRNIIYLSLFRFIVLSRVGEKVGKPRGTERLMYANENNMLVIQM